MGGRPGTKINQLKDESSPPLNKNDFASRLISSKLVIDSKQHFHESMDEQKEENYGEEDLSYVSGDERDFNEQI